MDLELRQQTMEEYIPVYHASWGQEETLETIVPDSLPDVARVVTVSGEAFVKEKVALDGKVRLSGSIRAAILYIPDGEDIPRTMEVTIPFQADRDDPRMRPGLIVHGSVSAVSGDTRIMNPRKLLLRCDLMCTAAAYEKISRLFTTGVQCNSEVCVEMLHGTRACRVITEAVEKSFIFSDVMKPSASKPLAEELLWSKIQSSVCEGKVIGRKLVCKGNILLSVLYRSGKNIVSVQFELPYSQVIELSGDWIEADVELTPAFRQVDVQLRDSEFEISTEIMLQACVWSTCQLEILRDAYSISSPFVVERSKQGLCVGAEQQKKRQQVRQFVELGVPAKQVLDCRCAAESFMSEETEKAVNCVTGFCVDILYLSEDDALCGVSHAISVSIEIPVEPDCKLRWSCSHAGEVSAVPVTGGVEVRFECEYECVFTRNEQVLCVTEIRPAEPVSDQEPRPSVIIRIVGANETLWDIAKSCGSSVNDICTANGISGDTAPEGMNLLIPVGKNT